MGNPDFAVPALRELAGGEHSVSAVVTGSDKRRGRRGSATPSPVKRTALELGLPILQTDEVKSGTFLTKLKSLAPDLLVVVAFKMLPREVLAVPSIGSLNLHASLLPKYRGAAPIHHALLNGETETGCTVFLLDEGMDTGAVLGQVKTPVGPLETTGDLYLRLARIGARLMKDTVTDLIAGRCRPAPQTAEDASPAPKILPGNARIDFSRDAISVHNLIRAMSPFPGAWTHHEKSRVKILRSAPEPGRSIPAGEVHRINEECLAGCGSGSIRILEIVPEGRKPMTGLSFINGAGGTTRFTP